MVEGVKEAKRKSNSHCVLFGCIDVNGTKKIVAILNNNGDFEII